ncbi:DUF4144 domain-containing protein [Vibrio cholerae]|nr:DUF4144 domain-containing protein [Vibrio cholerae]MBJ6918974.1 DUF4144 domain-containing protein [Vibrio cholerae]MBJ6930291.1 DUF4144 domain-containing protein [Vibrio cholerae]MBJ6938019.1 DUF4144 domain-containing protein [Vibrio cholerae]MBJ6965861.1 DUF4144 domain-containing protein [Vibrio cholerae]
MRCQPLRRALCLSEKLMVNWPCILKLDGDDELVYLGSEADLNYECVELIVSPGDRVIDSEGFVYSIVSDGSAVNLIGNSTQISAEEASRLIQRHEFCLADVCLTKIQFETVEEAFNCLKS